MTLRVTDAVLTSCSLLSEASVFLFEPDQAFGLRQLPKDVAEFGSRITTANQI